MSRNSKQKRDKKKKKLQRSENISQAKKAPYRKAHDFPEFVSFESPFKHLTDDQRRELIKEVAKESQNNMVVALQELKALLNRVYPISLLALVSKYGLSGGAGDDGIEQNQGVAEQFQVEFLQALILTIPIDNWGVEPVRPDDLQIAFDSLKAFSEGHSFSSWDDDVIDLEDQELSEKSLSKFLQMHTKSVRNWGFFNQVNTISTEIFSVFDVDVDADLGFSCSDVISLFNYQVKHHEQVMTEDFLKLTELKKLRLPKKMLEQYLGSIGQEEALEEVFGYVESMSHQEVLIFIMNHMDLSFDERTKINFERIESKTGLSNEKIKNIVTFLSIEASTEGLQVKDLNYFWLENPIWLKPIIKFDGSFYCPIPQMFFSFILPILDDLVRQSVNDQKVNDRRANYLEQKLKEIVLRRFPETKTLEGFKWSDNGQRFETDLVTFIDSYVIIFEAKSHKISWSALRGGKDRAKRHLKDIVISPNKQATRFQSKLVSLIDNPDKDDPIREQLPVELSKIHKILRVSVTLESLAHIQTHLSELKKAKWLPPNYSSSPNMTISDFEIVFDLLEHPVQLLHYLEARTELEESVRVLGDELDYLGMYTKTLLNLESFIPEGRENTTLTISGSSEIVDKYYDSLSHGIVIKKPAPTISPMFEKIHRRLEERSVERWSEIGVALCRVLPEDQVKLERQVKNLEKVVHKRWNVEGHKNTVIYSPRSPQSMGVAVVLYKHGNSDRRGEFIENAIRHLFEDGKYTRALVIAKNIDSEKPFSYIGIYDH